MQNEECVVKKPISLKIMPFVLVFLFMACNPTPNNAISTLDPPKAVTVQLEPSGNPLIAWSAELPQGS
jgi:hypothetical protein